MLDLKRRMRSYQFLRGAVRLGKNAIFGYEWADHGSIDVMQKSLIASWRLLHAQGVVLPFHDVGFQVRSGDEEDGLLLYVFALCGTKNRTVVEISAQDGRQCMAANLLIHHRWRGYLFDGDPVFIESGRRFFARHPATRWSPPTFRCCWFDRDNVDDILRETGIPPEVDLLSLDITGVDLHVWRALTAVRPRVLIAEFNNAVPSSRSVTVPYRPDFDYHQNPPGQEMFRSASLRAFDKVSRSKGYRLVGMNALAYNAIFLREDVGAIVFTEMPVSSLDAAPEAQEMVKRHWGALETLPWEEV